MPWLAAVVPALSSAATTVGTSLGSALGIGGGGAAGTTAAAAAPTAATLAGAGGTAAGTTLGSTLGGLSEFLATPAAAALETGAGLGGSTAAPAAAGSAFGGAAIPPAASAFSLGAPAEGAMGVLGVAPTAPATGAAGLAEALSGQAAQQAGHQVLTGAATSPAQRIGQFLGAQMGGGGSGDQPAGGKSMFGMSPNDMVGGILNYINPMSETWNPPLPPPPQPNLQRAPVQIVDDQDPLAFLRAYYLQG